MSRLSALNEESNGLVEMLFEDVSYDKEMKSDVARINKKISEVRSLLRGLDLSIKTLQKFSPDPVPDISKKHVISIDVETRKGGPHFGSARKEAVDEIVQALEKDFSKSARVEDSEASLGVKIEIEDFDECAGSQVSLSVSVLKPHFDRSLIKRFLEEKLKEKEYSLKANRNDSIRVLKSMNADLVASETTTFIDTIKPILGGSVEVEFVPDSAKRSYSDEYNSIEVDGITLDGFIGKGKMVFTLAFGPKDPRRKERLQFNALNEGDHGLDKLISANGGNPVEVTIAGDVLGPFTSIEFAPGGHAKADIVFHSVPRPGDPPETDEEKAAAASDKKYKEVFVSLKDGTNPQSYRQWGGMVGDKSIMNDPRSREFFRRVLASCVTKFVSYDEEKGILTFDSYLKEYSSAWAEIPPAAEGKGAYTHVAVKAVWGKAAPPLDRTGVEHSQDFCNYVIQGRPASLGFEEDGTLKTDGRVYKWPDMPTLGYTPVFHVSRSKDAINLTGSWLADFKSLTNEMSLSKESRDLLSRAKRVRLTGLRFLIYPSEKTQEGKHIQLHLDRHPAETKNVDENLLKELLDLII